MIFGRAKKSRNMRKKNARGGRGSEGSGLFVLAARWQGVDWGRFFIILVGVSFFALWCLLWSRFYVLQVVEGPDFAARAERQHKTGEVHTGLRGAILDRNGSVLAGSVETFSLSARPGEMENLPATVAFLSKTLGMPEKKLAASLAGKRGFVWVQRKISDRKATAIAESGLPGLYLQKEHERFYPYKHLAGQLLGFVGVDSNGLEGLEAAFDDRLSGRELRRTVQRDARGGRMYMDGRSEVDELGGQNLSLTIDAQVQFFAESAIARAVSENDAAWGGCMVVDVKSGDILAWAQYPFFNPNSYASFSASERRNRLAQDALEQGSTVKPFAVAAAIEEEVVTRDSVFDCENGKWRFHGKIIRDTRPQKELNVEQILRYSSNIGMGKIGLAMGAQIYGSYLEELGFGQRSALGVPGENPGILRPASKWYEIDLASASFGQSFSATTLQMAQAYLCLANGGVKKSLQLFRDEDLRVAKTSDGERVFSAATSRELLSMLRAVVHEDDGGGRFARIPGMVVGGKTGTAQKAENGVYGDKRTASFVGLAPAEAPELLVLVVVDEPLKKQYGSAVATPVFREVTVETLAYSGVLPDPGRENMAGLNPGGADTFDPTGYAEMRARQDAEARAQGHSSSSGGSREVRVSLDAASPGGGEGRSFQLVPDVRGLNIRQAIEIFAINGIMPSLVGQGDVVEKQSPHPGTPWPHGLSQYGESECVLWLKEQSS